MPYGLRWKIPANSSHLMITGCPRSMKNIKCLILTAKESRINCLQKQAFPRHFYWLLFIGKISSILDQGRKEEPMVSLLLPCLLVIQKWQGSPQRILENVLMVFLKKAKNWLVK